MRFAIKTELRSWHAIRPKMRKPLGFARQGFGDESRDGFEILRLRKNNHDLRFVYSANLGALRVSQAVGALAEYSGLLMKCIQQIEQELNVTFVP